MSAIQIQKSNQNPIVLAEDKHLAGGSVGRAFCISHSATEYCFLHTTGSFMKIYWLSTGLKHNFFLIFGRDFPTFGNENRNWKVVIYRLDTGTGRKTDGSRIRREFQAANWLSSCKKKKVDSSKSLMVVGHMKGKKRTIWVCFDFWIFQFPLEHSPEQFRSTRNFFFFFFPFQCCHFQRGGNFS